MRFGLLVLLLLGSFVYAQNNAVQKGGIVAGIVIDAETNNPVAGATVQLSQAQPKELRTEKTDTDGHFTFLDVPFGEYKLMASAPGFFQRKRARINIGTLRYPTPRSGLAQISVRNNEVLKVERCGRIFGKIMDPGARLMPDGSHLVDTKTKIELLQQRPITDSKSAGAIFAKRRALIGDEELAVVDWTLPNERGEYSFDELEPGAYYLAAHPNSLYIPSPFRDPEESDRKDPVPRTTYFPRSLRGSGATPITINVGELKKIDFEIFRREGVRVTGRLVLPAECRGQSLINVSVTLWPDGVPGEMMPIPIAPVSTANGRFADRFELIGVLPGRYVLHATVDSSAGSGWEGHIFQILGAERAIEIADEDIQDIELSLRPPIDLAAEVQFNTTCPAKPIGLHYSPVVPVPHREDTVIADKQGTVVLHGLYPGRYTITTFERADQYVASLKISGSNVHGDELMIDDHAPESVQIVIECKKQ